MILAFMTVLIYSVACFAAVEVPEGGTLDLDYAILGDWLDVFGTVNMNPGAYLEWGTYAFPGRQTGAMGAVVNIYGCATGNTLWVSDTTSPDWPGLPPVVTIYGPKFKIGAEEYIPPADVVISGLMEVLSADGDPLFSLTIYSDIDIHLRAPGSIGPREVEIDVKPGSVRNPINPASKGLIPVAILTTDEFDAACVDPGTVKLAGASVAVRGKAGKFMAHLEDVDGDCDFDLVLHVDTQSEGAVWESGEVILTGRTYEEPGAEDIQGSDYIIIVPKDK